MFDYAGSNPVFAHLLGERLFLTRRAFLLVTPHGSRLLLSRVDAPGPARLSGCSVDTYVSWTELRAWLDEHVAPLGVVAMEYSPHGDLPAMSVVDGGTIDLVRELGVEVRSSADLYQGAVGAWSDAALLSHRAAMEHAVEIKDLAFEFLEQRIRARDVCTEHDVQGLILDEIRRRNLTTNDPPIVAANAHSSNPHYVPSAQNSATLHVGDWLLIDLWCREKAVGSVYADITWVGYLGQEVPDEHKAVFEAVIGARDSVIAALRQASSSRELIRGYELDDVARRYITDSGLGDHFTHRTGHALGPESLHGLTVNLDNYETHDTRPIVPGIGFTVEPGIYLPSFGVRSEIDVYMGKYGPEVTSPIQTSPRLVAAT